MEPIDLTLGDCEVVRKHAFRHLLPHDFRIPVVDIPCGYAAARGIPGLIELVESMHPGFRALLTCGAIHALDVVFRYLRSKGHIRAELCRPYWGPITEALDRAGVLWCADRCFLLDHLKYDFHADENPFYLLVSPNNPDGAVVPARKMTVLAAAGIPVVHDAAYAHEHFMLPGESVELHGSIVVRSVSKMLGLSGLRVGFILCRDEEDLAGLARLIDGTTSSCSTASQIVVLEMLKALRAREGEAFTGAVRSDLLSSRREMDDALSRFKLSSTGEAVRGPFGWWDVDSAILERCGIVTFDGARFGAPGRVRANLAVDPQVIASACSRLRAL